MNLEEQKYRLGQSTFQRTIATGATSTIANQVQKKILVVFNPTATLAAHAATLPDAPVDQQEVEFLMMGSGLTSGITITAFSVVAAGNGITISESAAPGSSGRLKSYSYRFIKTLNTWVRKIVS